MQIDGYFFVGSEKLFLPADPNASFRETANCRCDVKYMQMTNRAQRLAAQQAQLIPASYQSTPSDTGQSYSIKPGVNLPSAIQAQVTILASTYFQQTGVKIVITSGSRTPQSQAAAMYSNLSAGKTLRIYKNQRAAKQIEHAYQQGKAARKSKQQTISDMASVIWTQMRSGIYISRHLHQGAVDVRTRGLSAQDQKTFISVANSLGYSVIYEGDHFHIQF